MRYTSKFIEARFHTAMAALGVPHGDTWAKQADGTYKSNVGTYFIDYNPIYGGRLIAMMFNEGGAESQPFGSNRHSADSFVALLDGIIGAARIMKRS